MFIQCMPLPRPRPPAAPEVAPRPARRTPSRWGDLPPRQARILEAALDLFVARGFHGTSIPEIARRAGVAAGTIYVYFDGKESLVNALVARLKGDLARDLLRRVRTDSDIRAQFEAIWDVFSRAVLADERVLAFCDLHHHAGYLTPETLAAWEPGRALLTAHFQAGRREGVYRDLPPEELRAVVAGVLIGLHKFARAGELTLEPALLERGREAAWAAIAR